MKNFKTFQGIEIPDLYAYVENWVKEHPNCEIYVGCDSQEVGKQVNYVTTICMYNIGKGAHVIHRKETEPRPKSSFGEGKKKSMFPRLWAEVTKSIEVAEAIKDIGIRLVVHVDYNSKPTEASSYLYESGIGYAKAMGFDAEGKPYAVAASCAADNYCR